MNVIFSGASKLVPNSVLQKIAQWRLEWNNSSLIEKISILAVVLMFVYLLTSNIMPTWLMNSCIIIGMTATIFPIVMKVLQKEYMSNIFLRCFIISLLWWGTLFLYMLTKFN